MSNIELDCSTRQWELSPDLRGDSSGAMIAEDRARDRRFAHVTCTFYRHSRLRGIGV